MRYPLRFVLPCISIIVFAPLVLLGELRLRSAGAGGLPPELFAAYAINSPATLFRHFVSSALGRMVPAVCTVENVDRCYYLVNLLDPLVFLLAVWMLWYIVGLEIEMPRTTVKRAILPSRRGARIATDLLLVLGGMLLCLIVALNAHGEQGLKAVLQSISYLTWGVAMTLVYGRDLIRCFSTTDTSQDHAGAGKW